MSSVRSVRTSHQASRRTRGGAADGLIRRTTLFEMGERPRGDEDEVRPRSRYDGGAAVTPGDLARPAPHANLRTAIGAVDDPWQGAGGDPFAPPQRVQVAINKATDVLEKEMAHGRITAQQYLVGRVLQEVFERGLGARSPRSAEAILGVDDASAMGDAMTAGLDVAKLVAGMMEHLVAEAGEIGARFLYKVLAEGNGFAQIARETGKGDSRIAVSFVAQRFRDLLEDVTTAWIAKHTARGVDPEREPLPIRGERTGPSFPGEVFDVNGIETTPTRAFRVADDLDATRRWRPARKRRELEAQAAAKLKPERPGSSGRRA